MGIHSTDFLMFVGFEYLSENKGWKNSLTWL